MRPIDWKEFRDVCVNLGWIHERTKGDHYVMTQVGYSRPVVIPMKRDLKEDIILSNLRTMGINRKSFELILNPPKSAKLDETGTPSSLQ